MNEQNQKTKRQLLENNNPPKPLPREFKDAGIDQPPTREELGADKAAIEKWSEERQT